MDPSIIGFAVVLAACLGVMIVDLLDRDPRMKRVGELFGRVFAVLGIASAVAACGLGIIIGGSIVFQLVRCEFHSCRKVVLEIPLPVAKSGPAGITLGPDGALWFTEADGNRIGRITVDGQITEFPVSPGSKPVDIAAAAWDGGLWVTESHSNEIWRMFTDGESMKHPIPTPNSMPDGITAGPDDAFWFTEYQGNKIGWVTASVAS